MSNQILPGKLSAKRTVSAESPIVVEKKKKSGKGLLLFLMAVGIGAVALTSISLLAPVTFYDHVGALAVLMIVVAVVVGAMVRPYRVPWQLLLPQQLMVKEQ